MRIQASKIRQFTVITLFLAIIIQLAFPEVSSARKRTVAKHSQVLLLRGIFDVFSLGLDDLALRLKRKGISTTVVSHRNGEKPVKKIIADYKKRKIRKLIIVGHSWGADAAISIATELDSHGIRVDYLVTLDPTKKQTIPGNVKLAVNYLLPQSNWGITLTRANGSKRSLRNIKLP